MKVISLAARVGAAMAAVALGAGSAQAVLFNPGDTLALPGTTSAAEPHLGGLVLEDESVPFSFVGSPTGGVISGTIQQRVVRSDVDGTVDFYWRVTNDSTSSGPLAFFRIGNFVAPQINANYRTDSIGTVPATQGNRFPAPIESFFNYRFDNSSLSPGQESLFMFMDTTAHSYVKTAVMDVATPGSSHISGTFSTFTPGVPEPTSALLAAAAGMALATSRRRGVR